MDTPTPPVNANAVAVDLDTPETPNQTPTAKKRVKVVVKRTLDSVIINATVDGAKYETSHFVVRTIKPFFDVSLRRLCTNDNSMYSLGDFYYYNRTIPLPEFANAIGGAIIKELGHSRETECAVEMDQLQQTGYLNIGDYIFKLQPVGMARHNKALALMRHGRIDAAKATAENIIADAKQMERELHRKISLKRAELEQLNRTNPTPPQWAIANHVPVMYRPARAIWCIGFLLHFRIATFTAEFNGHVNAQGHSAIKRKVWKALPAPPLTRLVWCPIESNGNYNVTTMFMDAHSPLLPHVSTTQACQGPGTAPKAITNFDQYNQLHSGLLSTHSDVVLHSLLVKGYMWPADMLATCPEALRAEVVSGSDGWFTRITADNFDKTPTSTKAVAPTASGAVPAAAPPQAVGATIETIDVNQEHSETWHA